MFPIPLPQFLAAVVDLGDLHRGIAISVGIAMPLLGAILMSIAVPLYRSVVMDGPDSLTRVSARQIIILGAASIGAGVTMLVLGLYLVAFIMIAVAIYLIWSVVVGLMIMINRE